MRFRLPYEVKIETSLNVADYDGILFLSSAKPGTDGPDAIKSALAKAYKVENLTRP